MIKRGRIVQVLLLLILLVNCVLLPELYVEIRDAFDPVMREVNEGHFSLHPASLILHIALALLPAFTLATLLRHRLSSLVCLAITAYALLYMLYGNYVATPRGLHASPLRVALVISLSIMLGSIFYAQWILVRNRR